MPSSPASGCSEQPRVRKGGASEIIRRRAHPLMNFRCTSRGEAHCRSRCRWRKLTTLRMSPGNRRRFLSIAIALICAPGVTSGQWLHYPTPDVPRTAAGKPDLTAPPPRLPEGRPDFSGIWQSAVKIPCTPEFSRFVECGLEIGGSPLALNIGAGVPGGLPYRPWAAALVKQRTERQQQGRPPRALPAGQPPTTVWVAAHDEGGAHAATAGAAQ